MIMPTITRVFLVGCTFDHKPWHCSALAHRSSGLLLVWQQKAVRQRGTPQCLIMHYARFEGKSEVSHGIMPDGSRMMTLSSPLPTKLTYAEAGEIVWRDLMSLQPLGRANAIDETSGGKIFSLEGPTSFGCWAERVCLPNSKIYMCLQ